MINSNFKEFFYFTKGERIGIVTLLALMVIVISAPYVIKYFIPQKKINPNKFKQEIAQFNKSLVTTHSIDYDHIEANIINRYDTLSLFYFDPNSTNKEGFNKLGLTAKQTQTILNYRSKGGKFFVKSDLQKIYGISQRQYLILKPYILLANKINEKIQLKEENNLPIIKDSLFNFDPNKINRKQWLQLGLQDKQIKIIKNYLEKGGKFYKKEDLKKIYGISTDEYLRMEPYITIGTKTNSPVKNFMKISINSVEAKHLEQINGIGEYLSKTIIVYREKLGGFVNKKQLLEVYHFPKKNYNEISNQIKINSSKIRKISLNFAEIRDFIKHPYLNYAQSKKIVDYRTKHGAYQSIETLRNKKIITKSTYNKIKPYLILN